ncbi:polysaccharide deacetylase family protein [Sporosarcina sp. OR05]|uniref:polysaccharide deacetylase family protein n=1 Tax=Sporosarcina sp. OR05 TaxID=2969819 RepID=UPI00352A890B
MKRLFFLVCLTLGSLLISLTSFKPSTTEQLTIPVSKDQQTLHEKIKDYAETHNEQPIDAVIDRVWKAIPGYNGLFIDVDQSFKQMASANQFDKELLIYKEERPAVTLADLSPSPIFKGNPEKTMVAFLINVAWGNEFIPPILKALETHEVKATFFLDGSWTKNNPEMATMIFAQGHEIGNHAFTHPDLAQSSLDKTKEELHKTNEVIQETIGVKPKWFGPPSGSFNQQTVDVARQLDMYTVLWTIDTVDWKQPETAPMVNKIVNGVENGSMVLMHPTKPTAEGMDEMIRRIKEKGLSIGTVSNLLSEQRMETPETANDFIP